MNKLVIGRLLLWIMLSGAAVAYGEIRGTVHNLTPTGPGPIKAERAGELCKFCHTPHSAISNRALWNQELSPQVYNLYSSSTLEAELQQPTGASRLCLSCHDGTTALGKLRIAVRGGLTASMGRLKGRTSLGTDLSDDHPVSFVYDPTLAAKQGQLADPNSVPASIPLDGTKQMQCTTCHDAHEQRYRKFLRTDDRESKLCIACHKQRNWAGSAHATSPASWRGTGTNPWTDSPYTTVSDNGCRNCHRSHAAPRPPRLLSDSEESAVCLVCHNGSVANKNLEREFLKSSRHPVTSTSWTHDPREDPNTMPRHVTCADCHNAHAVVAANLRKASGRSWGVPGVDIKGGLLNDAVDEYTVCLKCHGVQEPSTSGIQRKDNTRNIRLKLSPSNSSFHPVATVGKNRAIQGLEPPYNSSSLITCTDCHNNDEWTSAGTSPRGPHGSRYWPILEREYEMNDPSAESQQSYALCYKCHDRNLLISEQPGTFPHRRHVVDAQAPCAVCHDAHGARNNLALINFMLQDKVGKVVVTPSRIQKRLEFISMGRGQGQCFLECHGANHEPKSYP